MAKAQSPWEKEPTKRRPVRVRRQVKETGITVHVTLESGTEICPICHSKLSFPDRVGNRECPQCNIMLSFNEYWSKEEQLPVGIYVFDRVENIIFSPPSFR